MATSGTSQPTSKTYRPKKFNGEPPNLVEPEHNAGILVVLDFQLDARELQATVFRRREIHRPDERIN